MSESRLEAFLARLYTDADARSRFLENPLATASEYGLSASEAHTVSQTLDRVGLILAGRSFDRKRSRVISQHSHRKPSRLRSWIRQFREYLPYGG